MIRRLAAAAVVVAGCLAVLILAGAGGGSQQGKTVKIAFDNAFGLTSGGDLRVAGVKAGQTTNFDVSKGPECQLGHPQTNPPRTCAVVTAQVTLPGFQSFRSDATCSIRQQSLIGEYYVDCQPGNARQQLANNATIPDTRTYSTIPADLVQDILRQPYRDRLRLIIGELGTGLAGRPQDIAELLQHAAPALRQTRQVLDILANQSQTIENFLGTSNTVVSQLDQNKRDVARWIQTAGRTAQISATRDVQIAQGWQRLPAFLDQLRPTMAKLGQLTDAQTPLLRDLQRAAPTLTTFLTELGPFSNASIPAFQTLGQAAFAGNRAFRNSQQDINQLSALAQDAPGTAKPLRQFLETLDNRGRSPQFDIRAQQSAPPAPDPTAYVSGKGFTGFESILNYAYWQTLAINEFDPISHVLSAVLLVDPNCATYHADVRPASLGGSSANDSVRQHCNSYLGPYQPGVTAPDPTSFHNGSGGAQAAAAAPGQQPKRGQLAPTKPLPGQADYSHPNPTLPASTANLLSALARLSTPTSNVPGGQQVQSTATGATSQAGIQPVSQDTVNQALNYLLAP